MFANMRKTEGLIHPFPMWIGVENLFPYLFTVNSVKPCLEPCFQRLCILPIENASNTLFSNPFRLDFLNQ